MNLNPPPPYTGSTPFFFTALVESVRLLFEAARPNYVSGVTAGTTQTQAGATQLTGKTNNIGTVANASDAIKLPVADAYSTCEILNSGANAAGVWPAAGDAIDGGAADAVDSNTLAAGSSRRYFATDDDNWITLSNG